MPFVSYKGPIKYYLPNCFPGLAEGLKMMKEGGKTQLVVPSKLAFGGYSVLFIPRYSTLIIDLELLRVIKDPVADDLKFVNQWLDTLQLQQTDITEGIYLKIDKEGTGDQIVSYDTVKFQFKRRSVDSIYSFDPKVFTNDEYIVDEDSLIPGIRTAIKMLKNGSEARIILPYNMAWGRSGYINWNNGIVNVPPYTSFKFDIIIKYVGRSNTK